MQSLALNVYSSVFSAELHAILNALQWIVIHGGSKNVIVTGSYSVLQALVSKKIGKHAVLDEILILHHALNVSGLLIHFIWVPSHCGIPGNEIADRLTKVVFRFDPEINDVEIRKIDAKLSYSELKLIIRQVSSEKWNTYYKSYPTGGQYKLLHAHTTSRNQWRSQGAPGPCPPPLNFQILA